MGKAKRSRKDGAARWDTFDDPAAISHIEDWCKKELGIGLDKLAELGLARQLPLGSYAVRYPSAGDSIQDELAAARMFVREVRRRALQKSRQAQAEESQATQELARLAAALEM